MTTQFYGLECSRLDESGARTIKSVGWYLSRADRRKDALIALDDGDLVRYLSKRDLVEEVDEL